METKTCFACSTTKPKSEFYSSPKRGDSCSTWCKKCTLKKMKLRYPSKDKDKMKASTVKWRKKNPERFKELLKKYRVQRRVKVLEHYGNKCICCGETEFNFLTIDHINNDGATRRRIGEGGRGSGVYQWIITNNFPKHLQILCWNCNCAKGIYGKCPHSYPSDA